MSTYWFYRFRGALRSDMQVAGIDRIRKVARERFGGVPLPDPSDSDWVPRGGPCMGPHLDYDWSRILGFDGVSVRDGELCLSAFALNLEREPLEDDEGLTEGAAGTRLDQLMRFLTWATVGPEGEVVGCITDENQEGHAHPLVRCGDGRIRAVTTPRGHDDGWFSPVIEVAHVPALLPCDLIGEVRGSWARLDCEALRKRYLPLDGTMAAPMVGRGRVGEAA